MGKGAKPSYTIELCFGEEYPDPTVPKTTKLIVAQVNGTFSVPLLKQGFLTLREILNLLHKSDLTKKQHSYINFNSFNTLTK